MYPPDQRPPPWFVPPDPNHQPQATWQPPGGISHDQWVGCHGMSCDEWRRTEEKVTRLIGSTTPFIGSNAASGILVRIIMSVQFLYHTNCHLGRCLIQNLNLTFIIYQISQSDRMSLATLSLMTEFQRPQCKSVAVKVLKKALWISCSSLAVFDPL